MIRQTNAQNLVIIMTAFCFGLFLNIIITTDTFATTHSITVTTSGPQSIDVSPNINGGTTISTDNITVSTTCGYGYTFSISSSVSSNNLYLNGDSSNNTAGTYFTPVSGSTPLVSSPDSWGYYHNSNGVPPTISSTFLPIPVASATPDEIRTVFPTPPNPTGISSEFSIYYGVSVSDTMPLGTYKMIPDDHNNNGSILYFITMAEPCYRYTVNYNPTGTNAGISITGTGTVPSQHIYEDISTPLTSLTFNGTTVNGVTYHFAGWNTSQDGTGTQYASGEQVLNLVPAGSTITLYAQWASCPGGKICYRANGDNDVAGTMGMQNISNTDTSITLNASNFSRSGYGFAGWNTDPDGAGTSFGPKQDITFAAGTYQTNGLDLYAHWVEPARDINDEVITFQTTNLLSTTLIDGTTLASKPLGYVTALKDARDNQVYAIARLADGNFWMIENLRLENTAGGNSTGTLAQGYHSSFIGLAEPENSNFTDSTTSNSLYSTTNIVGGNQGFRFPRYNNANTASRALNPTYDTGNTYSYGNYYTWPAAIADTSDYSVANTNPGPTSICPTGWILPIGGETAVAKSFGALSVALGGSSSENWNTSTTATMSKKIRSHPNNFVYGGYYHDTGAMYQGTNGSYWSSTSPSNSNAAYAFSLTSAFIIVANEPLNTTGVNIRCVLNS